MAVPDSSPSSVRWDSLLALGTVLRAAREEQQITLHAAAHDIHVRVSYLDGLEQGNPDLLPDLVYVKGFVQRYGDYLGLEGSALSQQWALLSGETRDLRRSGSTRHSSLASKPVIALRPVHLWAVYVGIVIVSVSGLSLLVSGPDSAILQLWTAWQTSWQKPPAPPRLFNTPQEWTKIAGVFPPPDATVSAVTPPPNLTTNTVDPTAASAPTAAPNGVSSEPAPISPVSPPPALSGEPVQVGIRVIDRASWIRVIADNRTVLEDTLQPGTEMSWSAQKSIVLRAGNAGGISVTWNNQPQGALGSFGEVKEKTYTPIAPAPPSSAAN